jgi:hypothetical protein
VAPLEDRNGLLLRGDPLLDRPGCPPPGWFAEVDIALLAPHLKNALVAPVTITGVGTHPVHAPQAELDWTGTPTITVGYRLAQGFGAFEVRYRSLVSEGTQTIPDFDALGAGGVRSRLNMNVLDLDYASCEYSLGPWWDLKWRAGMELAAVYFDSRAIGQFLEERTSNNFLGVGPDLGLEVARHLEVPGLSAFAGVETAFLFGHIDQNYEQVMTNGTGMPLGGATRNPGPQSVPVLRFEAGLTWAPPSAEHMRFSLGYQFEHWWYLGQSGDARAELTDQGIFFRSEFNF